jgi:hypothetical protein
MASKYTMLFKLTTNRSSGSVGSHTGGWSESWYSSDPINTQGKQSFRSLCQARAALLSQGGQIIGQRYQNIDPVGRSVAEGIVFNGGQGACDVPQLSVFYTLPCAGVPNVRRITLRGVPDAVCVEGEYVPIPAFRNALQRFNDALVDLLWQCRCRNLTAEKVPIVSIDTNGTFKLSQPLTFAPNDVVTVNRVKIPGATLTQQVTIDSRVDAQNGKLFGWQNGATTGGTMQEKSIIYPTLLLATVTPRATIRKVGRPGDAYRGRASSRAA